MFPMQIGWIELSAVSALLLGAYDISKKVSVRENAVPVVLLASVTIGALLWLPFLIWSTISPLTIPHEILRVDPLSSLQHGMLFGKSVLVGASWTLAFFAIKRLPLSIAAPIRSTSPLWTIAIAATLLHERPSVMQWTGIAIVLIAFWAFSAIGLREGVAFSRDRGVALMLAATLLGALSSIYDKYLLQTIRIDPSTVQAWFSVYLVPVMLPMAVLWVKSSRKAMEGEPQKNESTFRWRWSILAISPLLLAADIVYFTAMADPDALVTVISVVRRSSVVIGFSYGVGILKEPNIWPKLVCVIAILFGVGLLSMG